MSLHFHRIYSRTEFGYCERMKRIRKKKKRVNGKKAYTGEKPRSATIKIKTETSIRGVVEILMLLFSLWKFATCQLPDYYHVAINQNSIPGGCAIFLHSALGELDFNLCTTAYCFTSSVRFLRVYDVPF